jgi:exopolyphosphatase/guanosine-5'-triphosphate,3'-diphosphate pyrophosphatase
MEARHSIAEALQPAISQLRALIQARNHPAALRLVGTAGTVTTLAAMHMEMTTYEPYRVNGLSLSEKWLAATIDLLAGMSLESRRRISGLEAGREDIILGGALIVMEVLRGFSQNRFIVMDAGLLEGLLLSLIEKEQGLPPSLLSPFAWLTTKR